MTFSTSLVAVWYSSDCSRSCVRSRNSPSNRAFSIAMTACAAKFSTSAISFSENGRTSLRQEEQLIVFAEGHIKARPYSCVLGGRLDHRMVDLCQIGDVDEA